MIFTSTAKCPTCAEEIVVEREVEEPPSFQEQMRMAEGSAFVSYLGF